MRQWWTLICGILGALIGLETGFAADSAIGWRGQDLYLSGCNVSWESYGADFAMVEDWGNWNGYSHAATDVMFADLSAAGCNCVRWWVFCDGRGGPEFGSNSGGNVTGLDSAVLANMDDAIKLAADHGIYIIFCLWDFAMLFDDSTTGQRGEHAGGHRNLVVDSTARGTFVTNALLPILQHEIPGTGYTIATHPNVLAWEVINEPEWAITESGSVDPNISQPVSLAQMQEFVADLTGTIHRNANQLVTVGSACLKWNSDTALGAVGNWWKDSALAPYDPDGALDFYQVHYYGWMNGNYTTWSYSPLYNDTTDASLDKPTIIGESPADGGSTGWTVDELIDGCYSNGYAGIWSWTYMGVDYVGDWSDCSTAYTQFGSNHVAKIQLPADLDSDGDGLPNVSEFIAGTDPGSAHSCHVVTIRRTNGTVEVAFHTAAAEGVGYGGVNRYYALEESTDLVGGVWRPVSGLDRIPGANGLVHYQSPGTNQTPRFYRALAWFENR